MCSVLASHLTHTHTHVSIYAHIGLIFCARAFVYASAVCGVFFDGALFFTYATFHSRAAVPHLDLFYDPVLFWSSRYDSTCSYAPRQRSQVVM